jgi:hypothetical protein
MDRTRQQVIELLHGYQAESGERASVRLGSSARRLEEVLNQPVQRIMSRLDAIDGRLAAIERQLGIATETPRPEPPPEVAPLDEDSLGAVPPEEGPPEEAPPQEA